MPVVLITEKERLIWTHEETKTSLIYRRPPSAKQRELQAEHTEEGRLNQNEYLEALIAWAVLDWSEGFTDDRGNAIKYEEGMTAGLPETYKAEFILNLYLVDPISAELGN